VNYMLRLHSGQALTFYADTRDRAQEIAQTLAETLEETYFRIYSLDTCPECHRTRENLLSPWVLYEDGWDILDA